MMSYPYVALLSFFIIGNIYNKVNGQPTKGIGVCYGFNGHNLPSATDAVNLYKKYGIDAMRIFEPNYAMMEALRGKEITLTLGVRNEDIPKLASSQGAAEEWFAANVLPYAKDITIRYISVGNEVIPGQYSEGILQAIQNLQAVILSHGLEAMRATTVVNMAVLTSTYPPSAATFSEAAKPYMPGIIKYLSSQGAPLLINVYPYLAYAGDPKNVRLDYAQFTVTTGPVVQDQGLNYNNLFSAMVDSFYWAMEKEGVTNVNLTVSETGWPHDGNGQFTNVDLAKTYNKNFKQYILSHAGTPKKPGADLEGYIFAMIDEDLKPAGEEQNFGMFKPNMEPNYDIFS